MELFRYLIFLGCFILMDHLNSNHGSHCSKTTSSGTFKSHDEQIQQWLEEESEHEFSDMDDEGNNPNFQPETELLDEDEILNDEAHQELCVPSQVTSVSERQPTSEEVRQEPSREFYKGKKEFMWSKKESWC